MNTTRQARVVAERLLTGEWQSLSALWKETQGQASWSTFKRALKNMVAEGLAEEQYAAPGKILFYRRPAEMDHKETET